MGIIKVMDEILANKIAAGEVVERISSVVKELVENSIDAKSTSIKVELIECGVKSIKIVDDGIGMSHEDAILCFSRHATSKIKSENDLYFINTLGFRGEALAAISSVSDVYLDTYNKEESTLVNVKGGKLVSEKVGSKRQGTSIEVRDLFYNTPARLKFMKSLNTELSLTSSIIEKISLSHPNIAFTLINDNKELIKTSGSGDLYKTIHEIFGYNISKNMIEIKNENYDFEVFGYVSNINVSKSNRNNMITLVNDRVVQNKDINRIILDAYHTVLAENKFPVVVISIITDPTLVDVNIHPTKQDIKVSKLDSLEDLLFNTIRDVLLETDNTFKGYSEEVSKEIVSDETTEIEEKKYENIRLSFNATEESVEYNSESILIKPVGLALGTYLIAQDEDIMYILDIHAANERINYERYLDALKNNNRYSTSMLFPIEIELTTNEYLIVSKYINVLEELGFKIEEFGINTYRVLEHPSWLKEGYEEESIRKIFDLLYEIKDKFDRVKFNEQLAINLACKMSVKANTSINTLEQEQLINRLFKCEFPYTCPHGRPTIIKYPIYELEKLFKRVN